MRYKLFSLFLLFCSIQQAFAGPVPDVPHIVVTGEYELRTTPDILNLSLSIAETGFEVATARDSVEVRSRELLASLASLGIAGEDISSAQLQITPHYNWNNRAQIYAGTEVSRTIVVTLKDLSRYDQLIRSIIDAGVARIHSTTLSSSQEKTLREEALRGAIDDGRKKAQIMIAHLPERLGPVYAISSQPSRAPHLQARYQLAEAGGQSAFEPGTIVFTESVQIVFYLVNSESGL